MSYGITSDNVDDYVVLDSATSYFKLIDSGICRSSSRRINGGYTGYALTVPNTKNVNPLKCLVFMQPLDNWIAPRVFNYRVGIISPFHYMAMSPNLPIKYRVFYLGDENTDFEDDGSRWGIELFNEKGEQLLGSYETLMDIAGHVERKVTHTINYSRPWDFSLWGYAVETHSELVQPYAPYAYYCIHQGEYHEFYEEYNHDWGGVCPTAVKQSNYGTGDLIRSYQKASFLLSTNTFRIDIETVDNGDDTLAAGGVFGHDNDREYYAGELGSYEEIKQLHLDKGTSYGPYYDYADWKRVHADYTETRKYMVMVP